MTDKFVVRMLLVWLAGALLCLALSGCKESEQKAASGDPAAPSGKAEPAISLQAVKYPELQQAIQAQRGRVVVLDVWATWCGPCKKEFPHLVKLHQRYGKDGIVCMSVSLDEPKQKEAVLAFLKSQKAAFPNYLLDEGEAGWDKLDLKGIPVVMVYDRTGKQARKFTNDDPDHQFTYADVEKFVQDLIRPSGSK
jgi:cytochrome c biogenesis protein CcmG/thiol:disulfide interchange protein DsbE